MGEPTAQVLGRAARSQGISPVGERQLEQGNQSVGRQGCGGVVQGALIFQHLDGPCAQELGYQSGGIECRGVSEHTHRGPPQVSRGSLGPPGGNADKRM